ncbi:MAG: CdaR family protein [Bacillota bacterium]
MDRLLNRDVFLQILSILLAIVLWIQATAEQNPEDQFIFDGVPVTAAGVPEGMVVAGTLRPAKVNITVRCGRRLAERLTSAEFQARVSLEGGHIGTYAYPVEVSVPAGVELVEISPATVSVSLEKMAEAEVGVVVRPAGSCSEGFMPGPPSVSPPAVAVRGPESEVSRVVEVLARPDLTSATADVSALVDLVPLDGRGSVVSGVTLHPARATVTVPVIALPAAESVDIEPVLAGSPAPGYAVLRVLISPDRASVRPEPGRTIDFDRVATAPVDISGATADVRQTVRLVTPPGVASVLPVEVEVTVVIGGSVTLGSIPVVVRNVPPGLTAAVKPAAVVLVVRGPRALLDRLGQADVVAWVDAGGRGSGTASVPVSVEFAGWTEGRLELVASDPAEVTLTLGP